MSEISTLDALDIRCPDFSLAARLFLDKVQDGGSCHIVTREERAELRLKHICGAYGYVLKGPMVVEGVIHFVIHKSDSARSVA